MNKTIHDSWVLLGLMIAGYVGALAIHKQLVAVRQTAQITKEESLSQEEIHHRTQNAIRLATLDHLLESTSPEIRWASVKILTERSLQSEAVWKILRRDLAGNNSMRRDKALASLKFLTICFGSSLEKDPFFSHRDTFKALNRCLCNLLPAAREAEENRQHHTPAETDALWILKQMMEICSHGARLALGAGIVKEWLSRYPLQCRWPEKKKKEVIHDLIDAFEFDDDYERFFCFVLHRITQYGPAREEMKVCGIGDPGPVEINRMPMEETRWSASRSDVAPVYIGRTDDTFVRSDEDEVFLVEEIGSESARRESDSNGMMRRREESLEERSLRRRRREAMVYAEDGGPIQSENIIEREETRGESNANEDLWQLPEESSEEGGDSDQPEGWWSWLSSIRPNGLNMS